MSLVEASRVEHQLPPHLERFIFHVPRLREQFTQSADFTKDLGRSVTKLERAARNESSQGELLINRALDLAITAYQYNTNEDKQFRKTSLPGEKPTPYSMHPVDAALHAIGEPTPLKVTLDTREVLEYDAQQAPYDARVVAATLLHDVIEDVAGIKGFGPVSRNEWEPVIKKYLQFGRGGGGTDGELNSEMVDDVVAIIKAVTKPTIEEINEMRGDILRDPHVGWAIEYLQGQATSDEVREQIPDQIVEVNAARHVLFRETKGNNFRRLAAIYCKNADNVNNMKTSGTKFGKLYWAHTNAELARANELPIATISLFGLTDNGYGIAEDPGSPVDSWRARNMRKEYIEIEKDRESRREAGVDMPVVEVGFHGIGKTYPFEVVANQIPVITRSERRGGVMAEPALQYVIKMTDTRFMERIHDAGAISFKYEEGQLVIGKSSRTPLHEELGVEIFEAMGRIPGPEKKWRTAYYVKFIDGTRPTGHDVLKRGSTASADDVPAMQLIRMIESEYDDPLTATLRISEKLSPLS